MLIVFEGVGDRLIGQQIARTVRQTRKEVLAQRTPPRIIEAFFGRRQVQRGSYK